MQRENDSENRRKPTESSAGSPGSCPNDNDRTKQLSVMGRDLDRNARYLPWSFAPKRCPSYMASPKMYRNVTDMSRGGLPGNPRINWNLASLKSVFVACLAISGCSENRDDAHDDQWLGSIATSNHKMSLQSFYKMPLLSRSMDLKG